MTVVIEKTAGLILFARTAEAGSFSAAARRLGTTPSAVSRGIARLERRVGVRLFLRSTRTVTLTHEGLAYFERIGPLLRALEDAEDLLRAEDVAEGVLRVSLPSVLGPVLMDGLTKDFIVRHPGLKLDLSLTDRHVDAIREGFDVVLRAGWVADTDLVARPLGQLPMALVASPAFLGRHGEPTDRTALLRAPHVRYMLNGRAYPIAFADGTDLSPTGVLDADSGLALKIAVLNGVGIAYLLRCAIEDDLRSGRLALVLPDHALRRVPMQALHAFGQAPPLRVRLFADFVGEAIGALALDAAPHPSSRPPGR